MTLSPEQFSTFFSEAHPDCEPYRWQQRLLEYVCSHGRWPEQILAPTGAGKTAVIDVHLFAVARMASGGDRVPRRLALVVDRRALTDDQHEYTRDLITALNTAPEGSVLGEVAAALRTLRWPGPDTDSGVPDPVLLGRLRGGMPPARAWRDEPAACTVLCATPAMGGSRLLFRGYGSTRAARPREAGLLAMDTVAVLDEAHLATQALKTGRRVAELAAPEAERLGVPALQVIETTATTSTDDDKLADENQDKIGVLDEDLEPGVDEKLRSRVCSKKTLDLHALPSWPLPDKGAPRATAIRRIAELALAQHAEFGATVGCYVNTVETALDLATELTRRSGLNIGVFCGRMRPHGAQQRLAQLHATGDSETTPFDVVVTTQTLEVGIDCSFSAGISELATGSALAQRAGRIGRTGNASEVTVLVPSKEIPAKARSGPYTADELTAAHQWLDELTDLAPWTIAQHRPPAAAPRRRLYQRLEPVDADYLTRTSTELGLDHDPGLWLAEDFDTAPDIGVLVRTGLPDEPDQLLDLLAATPVQDHEVFPTRLNAGLRDALTALIPNTPGTAPCVGRVRAGEASVLTSAGDLAPGDQVVVDTTATLFRFDAAVPGPGAGIAEDVLETRTEPGAVVLRLGDSSHVARDQVQWVVDAAADLVETLHTPHGRGVLAELLAELEAELPEPHPTLPAAAELLRHGRVRDCEVTVHDDLEEQPCRLIVRDLRRATHDEATRQTFTTATNPVLLADHNKAVGDHAKDLADALELAEPLPAALAAAGHHHDGGKIDLRFQRSLGNTDDAAAPIAKSPYRSAAQRRADRLASGLPRGWRHEQLSALHYARDHTTHAPNEEQQLVLRLIGTSHGHGRAHFPDTAADLLRPGDPDHALAEEWFFDGGWEKLIRASHRRWGWWGCAYLEALLRAADSQISMEGK